MTEQEANDYAVVTKERTKRICKQSYWFSSKGAKEALEKN
jgi:hypothetical protein